MVVHVFLLCSFIVGWCCDCPMSFYCCCHVSYVDYFTAFSHVLTSWVKSSKTLSSLCWWLWFRDSLVWPKGVCDGDMKGRLWASSTGFLNSTYKSISIWFKFYLMFCRPVVDRCIVWVLSTKSSGQFILRCFAVSKYYWSVRSGFTKNL